MKYQEFESLVANFYEKMNLQSNYSVHRNIQIEGPDGKREIDILLEGKLGTIDVRIIIECKDYKGKVTVQRVDEILSKMNDVKAHKAIMVSAKGFSKTALRKAKRCGIELCTISEALNEKWIPIIDLPILIEEIRPEFNFQFEIYLEQGTSITAPHVSINDLDIFERFHNEWNKINFFIKEYSSQEICDLIGLKPPFFLRNLNTQEKIKFEELKMNLKFMKEVYFGNLSALEGTLILEKLTSGEREVLIDINKLVKYKENFAKFDSENDIPNKQAIVYRCISKPTVSKEQVKINTSFKRLN